MDALADSPWRARLAAALAGELPDGVVAPSEDRPIVSQGAPRHAGVLVAVHGEREPVVYFTERSASLRHHAGQISFPGGSLEAVDRDACDAALREAHEEIGLAPARVRVLGALPRYYTVTGFVVSPYVGWLDPDIGVLTPDDSEVARLFSVPLAYLMQPGNYRCSPIERDGRVFSVYSIDYRGDHIWGATAGMLYGLVQRLAHAEGRPLPTLRRSPRPAGSTRG